jgi:hypothetical protein
MKQPLPECKYRIKKPNLKSTVVCELKLYGGLVTDGTCRRCIKLNQNNPEYAASLRERYKKSHPSGVARLSGCCDRADQA